MSVETIAGRFLILDRLHEGREKIVYRVEDLRSPGAIRVLKGARDPAGDSSDAIEAEWRLLTDLAHPDIIRAADLVFDDGGSPFLVLESAPGRSLADQCTLSPAVFPKVAARVLYVLAYLHEHGLAHLDIKPDNIIGRWTADGGDVESLKLIDFDLATAPGAHCRRRGTMPFVAPEVLEDERPIDGRADLYSLGVTLLALMSAESLPSASLIAAARDSGSEFSAKAESEYGAAAVSGLRALLAADPAARPATARDAATLFSTDPDRAALVGVVRPRFHGRKFELDILFDSVPPVSRPRVPGAHAGRAFVIVTGEGGSGRTRLVERALVLGRARSVTTIEIARSEELSPARSPAEAILAALPPAAPADEAVPADLMRGSRADVVDYRSDQRAVERILEASRTRTIRVVVDDIDSLDARSATFLRYLARRLMHEILVLPSPPPVQMILVGTRESFESRDWSDVLQEMRQAHIAEDLAIEGFAGDDFAAFVGGLLAPFQPSQETIRCLSEESRGRPGVVIERVLRAFDADFSGTDRAAAALSPATLRSVGDSAATLRHAARRLRVLDGPDRRLIDILAVHPGSLRSSVLAAAAGLDAAALTARAARLIGAGLIRETEPEHFRIAGADLLHAAMDDADPGERAALHDAVADALRVVDAAGLGVFSAFHGLAGAKPFAAQEAAFRRLTGEFGGSHPEEVLLIADAAARAAERLSPFFVRHAIVAGAEAALVLGRPREAAERLATLGTARIGAAEVILESRIRAAAADPKGAEETITRALDGTILDERARAALLLARAALFGKTSETARAAADLALARWTLENLAPSAGSGVPDEFDFNRARTGPLPPHGAFDRLFADLYLLEAENAWQARRLFDAARAAFFALKAFARLRDLTNVARSLHVLGNIYATADRPERASVYYAKAVAVHRRTGDLAAAAITLNSLGNLEINLGRHSEAIAHLRRALEIRRDIGDKSGEIQSQTMIGKAYLARGELPAAEKALKTALLETRRTARRTAVILNLLGVVNQMRGRYWTALGFFADAVKHDRRIGRNADALGYEVNAARLHARTGNYARAFNMAIRVLREADGHHVARAEAHALLVLADVHVARGRPLSARRALERAHDKFSSIDARDDLADVLVRLLAYDIEAQDHIAAARKFERLRSERFPEFADEPLARRAAVELRYLENFGDASDGREEVERAIALANDMAQKRRHDPAFIIAAALACFFDRRNDQERAFAYFTIALDQLEALVRAIGEPRTVAGLLRTEDVVEFSARSRAFVARGVPDEKKTRGDLPDEARQVFESIKKGFFDFERSVGASFGLRRRHEEGIRRILEISQTLSSTAPLDDLLVKVVDGVIDFTGAERGFVILTGPKSQWRIAVARTMHREPIAQPDRQVSTHIIDRIFETRRQMMVADAMDEDLFRSRASVINLELRAVMGAPMIRGDRMIGVLYVDHRSRSRIFQDDDLQLLRILATHVAIALENARLVREFVRDEKMRHMGLMASGVAHDFNNILAGILGRSQLLGEIVASGPGAEHVAMIDKAARDGTVIVKRLQDSTRLSKTTDLTHVFLRGIVADVIEFTRPRWETESLKLGRAIRVLNEIPAAAAVVGNAAELREVFTNVLLNAVAAMPSGGTVRFEGQIFEDRIRLFVRDTGIGMSESVRERIFDPFFTTKDRKGSGLGMSIVFGILMRHGGNIDVESQVGIGTTVTIELPRAGERELRGALGEPREPRGRGQCILVVDDEDGIRSLLCEVISRAGYRVLEAASAVEALDLVARHPVDAVLTDLGMVPMSGIDMAAIIKKEKPTMPIVLLTGWASEIAPDQAGMSHVDKMIGKPFNNADILVAIASLL